MRARLVLGVVAALAACSVKPVTFTPDNQGIPGDGSVIDAELDGDTTPDVPMFTVSVEMVGGGAGAVTSSPGGIACPGACTLSVPRDTRIQLTAAPSAGSTFTGWGGACTGTDVCAFTVTADTAVTAGIAANNELIVMHAGSGTGTVTSVPDGIACGTDCTHAYPPGTSVILSAAAGADSTFTGWSGDCTGLTSCQVTIDQARMVTATFAVQQRNLQITHNGVGSGVVSSNPAGISCGTDCAQAYDIHTVVTLTAAPNADSTFTGWSGGGCTGTGTCMVTLDNAVSVNAQFGFRSFVLSVTLAGAGIGSVQSNPAGITCGTDCSEAYVAHTVVTLTPTAGVTWSGACTGTGACQVTMLSAASVTATFAPASHLFTINEADQAHPVLQRLDPNTQVVTDVGPLGVSYAFGDCAWSFADSTLYVIDGRAAKALYRVSLATGAATLIGVHGIADLFALGYHPPSNQLYGVALGVLYTINVANGTATAVGPTGTGTTVEGLAWDSKRNRMIALAAGGVVIYTVNLATGAMAQVQTAGAANDLGMAYDPVGDRFLAADFSSKFFQLDPTSFARTDLPNLAGLHTCLAFTP
jgi:hypothetical protein